MAQRSEMELLNKDLSRFAQVAAHDIKSPCASIAMCVSYIKDNYSSVMDKEGRMFLDLMEQTSMSAIEMVNGILRHTQQVNIGEKEKEYFQFGSLIGDIKNLLTLPAGFTFTHTGDDMEIFTSRSVLQQILLNLCNNAIKYNDKADGQVSVVVEDTPAYYQFAVKDNGPGIAPEDFEKIFELFSTLGVADRDNNMGTGIGLATVKRLVQKLEGDISVSSEKGTGSIFSFTVKK